MRGGFFLILVFLITAAPLVTNFFIDFGMGKDCEILRRYSNRRRHLDPQSNMEKFLGQITRVMSLS
jgi:hypothetical protein